jgi:tRNA modification GTPase
MAADTIYALSSGRPPAAIAVIRISGPGAHGAGRTLAGSLPNARTAAVRELRGRDGDVLDEALVLRFDGPASATGEDLLELHCHGGRAVVDAVLGALAALGGLREAHPGEFTRRAFENGRIDLTEAEGLADLLEAETESQRKAALALAEGGLRRQIADWQRRLLELSARAEQAIDYVDEDEPAASDALQRDCAALAIELGRWTNQPRIEPLKDGVRVVVAGPPNAGKSSLVNVIAGEDRAIVTAVPGTTRDHIEVPLALYGIPLLLVDTAGLREAADEAEAIGVARAERLVESADVLVWLGDADETPGNARAIRLWSKADVRGGSRPNDSLPVSAVTGEGLQELLKRVAIMAKGLLPGEGAIALNRRQARLISGAAEAIGAAAKANQVEIIADQLRLARAAFDRVTGTAGMEDVLDALFGRFCLGK